VVDCLLEQWAARAVSESEELSGIVLDQAQRLFAGVAAVERLAEADRGQWPEAIWEAVEQAGLPLALVPEPQGGVGLAAGDGLALIRLAGYHALPVPLPETMMAAALWARVSGATAGGILSLGPTTTDDAVRIERSADGYALQGRAQRVPWGARAQHTLLHARDRAGETYFVLLPQGAGKLEALRNLAYEPRDTLDLNGVVLPASAVRAAPPDCAEGVLLSGALIRAQQMVGAMERVLDYALRHALERKQFGRPIGKFQAVQMMLAEAAGQYAAATAAADLAVEAYGRTGFGFAVAVAKARVGEAAGKVAEVGHQVHGAMGFTQEHPLHFFTRRLWSWRDEFGHEPFWQERIGRLVCSRGGEALWPTLTDA
jgi:acyl-CoA dehydrogenase